MEDICRFTPMSLAAFLLGNAKAIRSALQCRELFWIALLLTISAGFAREYDGEYLVAEPWYLVVPFVVSMTMGSVLFLVLLAVSARSLPKGIPIVRLWLAFLTGYLLLSPSAWLYAIPYERWYDEIGATHCNLNTLSAVSVWRVLLIARVAGVLFNRSMIATMFPVLLFAASATVIGLASQMPLPEIMGGVRLSDVERLIQSYSGNWFGVAFYSWPFWFIGSIFVALSSEAVERQDWSSAVRTKPSRGLCFLAAATLLIWVPLLPTPQREQRNRYEVERLFKRGEIDTALRLLSDRPQSDFPPLWRPPPLGYDNRYKASLVEVLGHFTADLPSPRVRRSYFEKLNLRLSNYGGVRFMMEPQDWITLSTMLRRIPEGPDIAKAADKSGLIMTLENLRDESSRRAVQEILDLATVSESQPTNSP